MINIEGMDYYRAQQLIDATVDFAHRVMANPDMREAVHKKVNELRQEGFFEKPGTACDSIGRGLIYGSTEEAGL